MRGERLPRGVPAERGSAAAEPCAGNAFAPQRPPPASGQEMAGDRVVSVAGDLPCERMRTRAGVCQSLFLRDWVFLPSSIIILKVTASSNERRSSPMARCTFSSRYTSVLRWM